MPRTELDEPTHLVEKIEEVPGHPAPGHRSPQGRDGGRRAAVAAGLRNPHVLGVSAIVVVCAALLSSYSLLKYWHYSGFSWDLEIFDQAVRNYAHFHAPRAKVLGVTSAADPGHLQLADHFSPILALLAPLYWIHDGPATLLVAQGVLFSLAVPPLWVFARRKIGTPGAYLVSVCFALAWPLQTAVDFDFHEVAFAVPLTALMIERLDAGRSRQAFVAAGLLLLVKEDMGFVVLMLGGVLALRGSRRTGAQLAALGAVAVAVTNFLILPPVNSSPGRLWMWGNLGATPGAVVRHMAGHPIATATGFLDPPEAKVRTLVFLLAPVVFLALRSRLALLALPLIGERFLSDNAFYWGTDFHYNAYLVPILFFAAVEGASRLPRLRWSAPAWGLACLAATLVLLPRFGLWHLTDPAFRTASLPQNAGIEAAIKTIPDGAVVAAYPPFGVHLTERAEVLDVARTTFDTEWVISLDNDAAGDRFVAERVARGYVVRYRDAGLVVLQLASAKP